MNTLMKTFAMFALLAGFLLPSGASAESVKDVTLYKNPYCTCCEGHVAYLRQNGFKVKVVEAEDLSPVKEIYAVPEALQSCHTAVIGGYVVEGHVSVGFIHRLLAEKPGIVGISLPGMPMGVPGMGGEKSGPLVVYAIAPGAPVYGTE